MTPLETALLAINGGILAALACLWFSTHLVTARAKTMPEALVRLLYTLARRLNALAEALDSAILCYREMCRGEIQPRAELERRLREARNAAYVEQWRAES